jgi:hypothetical protein
MTRLKASFALSVAALCAGADTAGVSGQASSVPVAYRRFFQQTTPAPGFWARVSRAIGYGTQVPYTRSFAIVSGVWSYQFGPLEMAQRDVRRLVEYLKHYESFDEIVVLTNDDFNETNLRFFLQTYFPEQLKAYAGSRFLFAFSGHGTTREIAGKPDGYLLLSTATSLTDFTNALNVDHLMTYGNGLRDAQHTLFLLNSCFSGTALETAGKSPAFDTTESIGDLLHARAFHVMTAGAANELVKGSLAWGGSLFFAAVLEALDFGDKDRNGVVSFNELEDYVRPAVINQSANQQHPLSENRSTLLHPESRTKGSFLFFNRQRLVAEGVVSKLPANVETGGTPIETAATLPPSRPPLRRSLPSIAPAAAPVLVATAQLRSMGKTIATADLNRELREKGLPGSITNRFEAVSKPRVARESNAMGYITNNPQDRIVLDRATGLMWENESLLRDTRRYLDAYDHIRLLNEAKFGGFSDWRMPTMEEAASLYPSRPGSGSDLARLFGGLRSIWTSDTDGAYFAWVARFDALALPYRVMATGNGDANTVRAVRTVRE